MKGENKMTINEGVKFIFDGQYSDQYGVEIASALGSTSRSSSAENRNIITTKNSFSNLFNFHGVTYDSPLQFDIIIYNTDGTWIDAYKERHLKKWLLKNKRCWLQIEQDDLSDIEYYVVANSIEVIDVGTYSGGMKISFSCDSPWAWSGLKKKTYTTIDGTLTFNFNSVVDFDEYILYPQLTIVSNAIQTIKIKNNTTSETIEISDCTVGEIIYLDCNSDKIKNSNNAVMLDRWIGKQTIGFIEGLNSISLTGDFSMTVQYRLPIRVGG